MDIWEIKFLLSCSGVFLFFYPCGFILFTRHFFESCFLFFLWKSNFLSPFDALQKRSFSAYFHFYLSILSFFVVSSLRRFHWWYHTMSDYCTVDFGIFFIIFRLFFFRFRIFWALFVWFQWLSFVVPPHFDYPLAFSLRNAVFASWFYQISKSWECPSRN